MDLEVFTSELFNKGSKELKEVIQLLSRFLGLVIEVFEGIEQRMNHLEQKIDEFKIKTSQTPTLLPQHVAPTSFVSTIHEQHNIPSHTSTLDDELRTAIHQRSNHKTSSPSDSVISSGRSQDRTEFPPTSIPHSSMGVRAALQSELKEAFRKLKGTLVEESIA